MKQNAQGLVSITFLSNMMIGSEWDEQYIINSEVRPITGINPEAILMVGDHYDHPLCPGLQPGPPSQTPGGLGQRYWSGSVITWPPKPGVSEAGVFRAIQPNALFVN